MNNIRINLLPKELVEAQKQNIAARSINRLSVLALLGVAFLAALTLSVRLSQMSQLQKSNSYLTEVEAKVTSLQDRETQLALIREYLKTIESYSSADAKKKAIFNLVAFIAPSEVTFNDVSISRDGKTVISASSPSLLAIERLVGDLSNPEKSTDLISKIDLEGLTLGKDSRYRFGIMITTK